jgi:hypothetical protein
MRLFLRSLHVGTHCYQSHSVALPFLISHLLALRENLFTTVVPSEPNGLYVHFSLHLSLQRANHSFIACTDYSMKNTMHTSSARCPKATICLIFSSILEYRYNDSLYTRPVMTPSYKPCIASKDEGITSLRLMVWKPRLSDAILSQVLTTRQSSITTDLQCHAASLQVPSLLLHMRIEQQSHHLRAAQRLCQVEKCLSSSGLAIHAGAFFNPTTKDALVAVNDGTLPMGLQADVRALILAPARTSWRTTPSVPQSTAR